MQHGIRDEVARDFEQGEYGRAHVDDYDDYMSNGRLRDVAVDSGNGEIVDSRGEKYSVKHDMDGANHDKHRYTAKNNKGQVASSMTMSAVHPDRVMSMHTYPEFRRRGLANALHNHAEKHLGVQIRPTWATTTEGEAFYQARHRGLGRSITPHWER
jgi:GNAT superfamily N-acetyltransferase